MTETPILPSDMPEEDGQEEGISDEQADNQQDQQENIEQTGSVETGSNETGLDTTAFEKEFLENGQLSEESYKLLAEKGISKEVVDRYIEGRKAYVQAYDNEVMNSCGGREEYTAMAAWAAENLSNEEKASFNGAVNSRDLGLAKLAVSGLYARYKSAGAGAPQTNFIEGTTSAKAPSLYKSEKEIVQDKKDARYEKDAEYRKSVDEKIRRSIAAGTI